MPTWILFSLLSAFFAALVAILGKIGVSGIDSTLATTVRGVVLALFLLVVSLLLGKFNLLSTIHNKAFLFIVLSGIAGGVSMLFYFFALKSGPVTAVASLDRLSVVFVFLLSLLLLGDKFDIKYMLGVLLITAGAVLTTLK